MGPKLGVITLHSLAGHPTSEPFGPGENLSELPKIARGFGSIFSVMIEAGNPENFRSPYYTSQVGHILEAKL